MHPELKERLFNRHDLCARIYERTGVRVPKSRFDKDAAKGKTPLPVAVYGKVHLYTEKQGLDYARRLIRPAADEAA